jgi:Cu(I)/Ag(I) efflux system protein CusF
MKKLLITAALVMLATPALAKEYTIKEISDPAGSKPYYFSPDNLAIQPGDTVTFMDAQEDMHNVMFIGVPKAVDEMIMGPMQEKEGSKWSYKFTIPGTYQFHCHPHEALGMKGTLIVGTPSKPGDTKVMDHHHMTEAMGEHGHHAHAAAASGVAAATGKINGVDAANHSVNVTHDPIKALGWPKMKMEFTVDKSVDLSGLKAGDAVSFKLKPVGDNDYTVVEMKKAQ